MRKIIFLLFFVCSPIYAQISDFAEVFQLPNEVEETSGLIFVNGKIITHNDSGGDAKLYEIDNDTGLITRIVTVNNAVNIDWEALAQDDTHIYVADIGNNSGNRQDLTIYKILKNDYLNSTSVTAEVITYTYQDQSDFSSQPNNTNFDAEAIAIYQNKIFIFTKNWVDNKTNLYSIPVSVGDHIAQKVSTYDVAGLITDANYNPADDSFMLTGYDTTLTPFLVYIDSNRASGDNVFSGNPQKISLTQELGPGNQVEGVTNYTSTEYYISRERFDITVKGMPISVPQKLFQFVNLGSFLLSNGDDALKPILQLKQNPTSDYIEVKLLTSIESISMLTLYNAQGQRIERTSSHMINVSTLPTDLYYLDVLLKGNKRVVIKVVKI